MSTCRGVITGSIFCVMRQKAYIPSTGGIGLVHTALTQQLDHAVHIGQVIDHFIHPVIGQGRPA